MTVVEERLILQEVPCPECGAQVNVATGTEWRLVEVEDKYLMQVRVTSLDIIDGCEHADLMREEVIFVQGWDE